MRTPSARSDQRFERRHVAQLVGVHGLQQQGRRFVARAIVQQRQHLVAPGVEDAARLFDRPHQFLAFIGCNQLVELAQLLLGGGAGPGDGIALLRHLLQLVHQEQTARRARDQVDLLDDVIGQHGFRILAVDHAAHALVQRGQAQQAQRGGGQQQQRQHRERPAQARSDIHIRHISRILQGVADRHGCRPPYKTTGRNRLQGRPGAGKGRSEGGVRRHPRQGA